MAACPKQHSMAAPLLHTPLSPAIKITFYQKIWSKSVVHSPDPFKDALKRPIIKILHSITTTHHDGGLTSPSSSALANKDPPLPSTLTQGSRQNLREWHLSRNESWTNLEAVQLADKLEVKLAMAKADWECWKKLEEQFKQIHGLFSFDLYDNDQEQAHWDAFTREKCNVDVSQMAKEMDMLPYSSSPSPQQRGSHTKTSAQRERKERRRKRAGKTISCNVKSGEILIKEKVKEVCARPHSSIRLFVINEVSKDSMEEDYKDKGNKENNNANKNVESVRTGSSGYSVSSPDNDCKGGIDSMIEGGGPINPQSLCGIGNKDNDNDYVQQEACIEHGSLSLLSHNCKCFVYSTRESEDTIVVCFKSAVGSREGDANWILKIIVMIQGADLRRFDKHKQRTALETGEYLPVMN
jgi:hypothetical protein